MFSPLAKNKAKTEACSQVSAISIGLKGVFHLQMSLNIKTR